MLTQIDEKSQTCRRGDAISREPTLWLYAYHHLCTYITPPRLGGPLEQFPQSELEAIVMRMYRLDQNWQSDNPSPVQTRKFTHSVPDMSDDYIRNMDLLPGGRWLMTLMDDGIVMWDLDSPDIWQSRLRIISFEHPGEQLTQRRHWVQYEKMPHAYNIATQADYYVFVYFLVFAMCEFLF